MAGRITEPILPLPDRQLPEPRSEKTCTLPNIALVQGTCIKSSWEPCLIASLRTVA